MLLPNFSLAPLRELSLKTKGFADDPCFGFVIALATAYNDLKDYSWLLQLLLENPPKDTKEISAESGQWNGMREFCFRRSVATCFEVIELLQKNRDLFSSELRDTCLRLGSESREAWNVLSSVALRREDDLPSDLRNVYKALLLIRHNITFHYYGTKNFLEGIREYQNTGKDRIYCSFGLNMEKSRFYFADAATQCFISALLKKKQIETAEVEKFIEKIAIFSRFFIEAYMEEKSSGLKLNRHLRRRQKKRG